MYVTLEHQGVFIHFFIYLFISEIIDLGHGLYEILTWVSLFSLKKTYPER